MNKFTRSWDWLTAVLVFLLLQVSAARLVTTNWAAHLYYAETLAALGAILGLALGASRFKRAAVLWLVVGYTLVVVPWQISGASDAESLSDRLQQVGGLLLVSLGQFMHRQPVKAPLFFVGFACLVFWLLSIAAGYWAARHRNVLVAIIPSGILVVVIQVYANYQVRGSWWLGVYLLLALLLVGRAYFLHNEKEWAERRVYVHDEAWTNILGALFTVALTAVLLAWLFPTSISSMQAATDTWTKITRGIRDRLSNAVTSLNGPYGRPGANFYGTSLTLGQDAAVGDSPVFTVNVLDPPASSLRYYWRGRVYDAYRNGQWSVSPGSTRDFNPTSGNLKVADTQDRTVAQLRFTLQLPTQSLIYAPSEPVWLDHPASVQVTPVETGLDDVLSWQAKTTLAAGNRYVVRAEIGNPNVEQLRATAAIYPKWVQDRYLEVPDSLRGEFRALAERVTAGQDSPYDKAIAITSYLRATLQYSTNVPAAPEGRDPIEWVLFSYKKGFCNYYASAEVLMLRSIGIPARLAVGFAEGEYTAGTYVVRRRDAHAWPEVFFPGLGWVEFEPTASQQPLVRSDPLAQSGGATPNRNLIRPLDDAERPGLRPSTAQTTPRAGALNFAAVAPVMLMILSVIAAALALYLFYQHRIYNLIPVFLEQAFERTGVAAPTWVGNWSLWNRLLPVERAFVSINLGLRWLGRPAAIDATPAERAANLKDLLPQAAEHIEAVASELETGLFTPHPADVSRARRSGWLVILHALRARLRYFLGV
ncbi:MAG TPA: transglutaminaseTgpA domain-containing protein [Anaerolineales bacterium]|nr:transglutaminaseTgpA domain-containing protein [Anaerolineales bacterium]